MRLLFTFGLLLSLSALAQPQAGGPIGTARRAGSTSGTWNQATTAALNLYVDTTGADTNACTASGTSACLTIDAACQKVPKTIRHTVIITVGAGTFASGGCYIQDFNIASGGSLTITGTLANFAPATGTATGTTTSRTTGSNNTRSTLTDSGQTWTVNNLRGQLISIDTGTGSGQYGMITSNTATAITIEGQFDVALAASGNTYSIKDWSTSISGPVSTYNNIQSTTPAAQTASFFVGTNSENQLGGVSNIAGTLSVGSFVIRHFKFTSGVTRAILLWGNTFLSVNQNSFLNGGADVQIIGGTPALLMRENVANAAANVVYSSLSGSATRFAYIRNNLQIAGAGMVNTSGFISMLRGESNESVASTTAAYRLSGCDDCAVRWDYMTTALYCFRVGQFNLSQSTVGSYSIDGITCNDWGADALAFNGNIQVKVDRNAVASTGTNVNAFPIMVLNQNVNVLWSSVTNFTVPASNDFSFNAICNGSGLNYTQVQLRAASPKSLTSVCDGSMIYEEF